MNSEWKFDINMNMEHEHFSDVLRLQVLYDLEGWSFMQLSNKSPIQFGPIRLQVTEWILLVHVPSDTFQENLFANESFNSPPHSIDFMVIWFHIIQCNCKFFIRIVLVLRILSVYALWSIFACNLYIYRPYIGLHAYTELSNLYRADFGVIDDCLIDRN